jgi:glutathione-regulated potassium-efflux system ancillary protein KefF
VKSVLVVLAHPYPDRSRANRALTRGISELPAVETRSLYDLYPDFSIDVEEEQAALERANVVVWQHPVYWYTVPALMKLWFEKVLTIGWAYGQGGRALRGKRCLWVATFGGDAGDYSEAGIHQGAIERFVPVVQQTARFCGMEWLEPMLLTAAHRVSDDDLAAAGAAYRDRLRALASEPESDVQDA